MSKQIPWLRVFVEGVVIVGSILLALALDAWRDGVQDRAAERTMLAALSVELEASRRGFEAQRNLLREDILRAAATLKPLSEGRVGSISTDSLRVLLRVVSPTRAFHPPRAALDDLLAGSGIALVRSDTLRRQIAEYDQSLALDDEAQRLMIDLWVNHLAPYRYEHDDMGGGSRVFEALEETFESEADTLNTLPSFGLDEPAYVGNRVYRNLLSARILRISDVREQHFAVIRGIDRLQELLARE